jgi:hypothetical protein
MNAYAVTSSQSGEQFLCSKDFSARFSSRRPSAANRS